MTKDEEIVLGLKDAAVPEHVFKTTLLKENAPDLRALITDKTLARPSSARGIYIHPKSRTTAKRARLLFYLVAKELFLTGTSIHCISLSGLLEAMSSDDGHALSAAVRIDRVRMVCVLDFYEDGAAFPLTPSEAGRIRSWVRKRFDSGNAVSFLSDSAPDRCTAWWPASFLGFINDNTIIHSV